MRTRPSITTRRKTKVEVGSLLIAQPFWPEEVYQHSAVLITSHDLNGATGVLLNKLSNLMVREALPDLNLVKPLLYGGPIHIKEVSYLHTNADVPETIYLSGDIFLGGDYDFIRELINEKRFNLRDIKFCAGSVEWSGGQLEYEISENKWWVCETSSQEIFSINNADLWAYKLLTSGHMYGLLGEVPDPSNN